MEITIQKPKVVVFDIGGVLLDWRGLVPKLADLLNIEDKTFYEELYSHYVDIDLGKTHQDEFWNYLSENYNPKVDPNYLKKTWIEEQPRIESGFKLLKDLKTLGYRVACCTNNWMGTVEEQVKVYPEFSLFEFIISSAQIGARKPDEKIYRIIEETLQLKGDDIFFIDDMKENCETAERLGWQAFQFDCEKDLGREDYKKIITYLQKK